MAHGSRQAVGDASPAEPPSQAHRMHSGHGTGGTPQVGTGCRDGRHAASPGSPPHPPPKRGNRLHRRHQHCARGGRPSKAPAEPRVEARRAPQGVGAEEEGAPAEPALGEGPLGRTVGDADGGAAWGAGGRQAIRVRPGHAGCGRAPPGHACAQGGGAPARTAQGGPWKTGSVGKPTRPLRPAARATAAGETCILAAHATDCPRHWLPTPLTARAVETGRPEGPAASMVRGRCANGSQARP